MFTLLQEAPSCRRQPGAAWGPGGAPVATLTPAPAFASRVRLRGSVPSSSTLVKRGSVRPCKISAGAAIPPRGGVQRRGKPQFSEQLKPACTPAGRFLCICLPSCRRHSPAGGTLLQEAPSCRRHPPAGGTLLQEAAWGGLGARRRPSGYSYTGPGSC